VVLDTLFLEWEKSQCSTVTAVFPMGGAVCQDPADKILSAWLKQARHGQSKMISIESDHHGGINPYTI
jgi:hypothetical protein